MGYYTRHELEIVKGDLSISDLYKKWDVEELEFKGFDYAVDENGECSGECKWYSHEEDMRKLSSEFPNVLFLLKGEGEDALDVWKEYYKDGKMQRCKAVVVYEAFDESKLD